jgi:hypothetical protein
MLFDPSVYERLLGAFELNNVGLEVESPLRPHFARLLATPAEAARAAAAVAHVAAAGAARGRPRGWCRR